MKTNYMLVQKNPHLNCFTMVAFVNRSIVSEREAKSIITMNNMVMTDYVI